MADPAHETPTAGSMRADASPSRPGTLSPTHIGSIHPEAIEFEPFGAFPSGAWLAKVVGDPTKPGPYVVRVKVEGGVRLLPHTHPEDRIYTVISGVFYIGFGSAFDPAKLNAYGPGSVVVLPGNTPHFHWAVSGEYISQVSGTGPLGIDYVDVDDDPRLLGARMPHNSGTADLP